MKRILILTVTAGNGHNACANAMKEVLTKSGNAEVKVVDLLKSYSTRLNIWIADKGYSLAVSRLPKIYGYFYEKYMRADPINRYSCPPHKAVMTALNGLFKEILSFRPDVIYCTHFYAAIALTDLKLKFKLPCKCIAANLDYVNSPFWEAGIGVDYFAIPNEDFLDEFLFEGYEREQLLPLGLPVDGRTLEKTNKAEARKLIGLDADAFTVLVMFGGGCWSGGFKIFKELLRALNGKNAQVIVINGKDEKGYKKTERIRAKSGINIVNVGFTDDVPLYLSAADLAICKCGGTGATELINKGVPMLITERVPSQEKYNIMYLKSKNAALSFNNAGQLRRHITEIIDDGSILERISANALTLRKNAIFDLAEFILSQPQADYKEFTAKYRNASISKKQMKHLLKFAGNREKAEYEF